ncbi:MAG: hypothetical protein ACLSAF_19455 [Intestinimonas sp.]
MKYLFRNDYSFGAHPKVLSALAETSLEETWAMVTTLTVTGPRPSSGISASVPRPRSSSSSAAPRPTLLPSPPSCAPGRRGGGRLLPYQRARGRRGGSHRA